MPSSKMHRAESIGKNLAQVANLRARYSTLLFASGNHASPQTRYSRKTARIWGQQQASWQLALHLDRRIIMIKALVFDFDGTILDTETPEFRSWQEIYIDYGVELPLAMWASAVGGSGEHFNPYTYLEEQIGTSVDKEKIRARRRPRNAELNDAEQVRPGVLAAIEAAQQQQMRLAVASSSHLDWVEPHLKRLGLFDSFDTICTADYVEKVKPDPALYTLTVERLKIEPQHALAIEDSRNGMLAAKRAGLHCVVTPHGVTAKSNFTEADLILSTLADRSFTELINHFPRPT